MKRHCVTAAWFIESPDEASEEDVRRHMKEDPIGFIESLPLATRLPTSATVTETAHMPNKSTQP